MTPPPPQDLAAPLVPLRTALTAHGASEERRGGEGGDGSEELQR
jgi:hypothetical protein